MTLIGCSSTEQVAKTNDGDRVATQEELDAAGYECKKVKNTTSRIKKKVCTTAAQRKLRTEKSKELSESLKGPVRSRVDIGI